jgi:hypothetical protein
VYCNEEKTQMLLQSIRLALKGLNIVGVSLDKDAAMEKKPSQRDKLTWTHVSI